MTAESERRWYEFPGFRLDAVSRELFGADRASIPLPSKTLDVLVHLIEHRDRTVGKDELLAAVWAGRVVEENNLTQAISALRKAFGVGARRTSLHRHHSGPRVSLRCTAHFRVVRREAPRHRR